MQSIVVYGRQFARTVFAGIRGDTSSLTLTRANTDLHLVTVASGLGKSQSSAQILKKWSFGDDACFIASHNQADVLGVADGVGGWRTYGVDPSQFPHSLMATCERLVKQGRFKPQTPAEIIAQGYYEMIENKSLLIGSCTACIVTLDKEDQKMYTANLGDSGFLVIRSGQVIERSEEQQHYFNTPFQLSVAPSTLQGVVLSDSPEMAQSTSFGVEEGDLILLGTDGLFDNLSEDMILHHVSKLKDHKFESLQRIANRLAQHANELAFDPDYMSPFALNAACSGLDIKGGKPDDITVLLARVTQETDSSSST